MSVGESTYDRINDYASVKISLAQKRIDDGRIVAEKAVA